MNLIRFFIPLLLAATCVITSCKKTDPGQSGLVDSSKTLPPDDPNTPVVTADSSKLLPSVISYYNSSDSLVASYNYTYDNSNRITKLVTLAHGTITDSKTFSYDNNDNLTNITEISLNTTTIIIPNPGTQARFDTTRYVIHCTNGLPDSTVITGSSTRKNVIKYVIENNKISTIKTSTYTEINIGIVGAPPSPPKISVDSATTKYAYTGDDLTQVIVSNEKTELNYSTHKSAFYAVSEKWPLVTESGFIVFPKIFTKHDVIKITTPFADKLIDYNYNSLYNKYDYPTETAFSGSVQPPNSGGGSSTISITPLKFKYKYILAK